ncbi:MAG: 2,3-bisphosphoglycerate-independent phosphoglycerate mutase [Thermodesulfobacteriota bacterium]
MKPVMLIVLDGWGVNNKKDGNAIETSGIKNIKRLASIYPHTELNAGGLAVGLPEGQMGNSEVGHLTLGAGRVMFQELTRIGKAIKDGSFRSNPVLEDLLRALKENGAALHLMGLVSDGGVHSHVEHLYAILVAAKEAGLKKVFIHAFMDGRDTPPKSGRLYMERLVEKIREIGVGEVATVSGRYYAMDRDKRWDRVKRAYEAIAEGIGVEATDPVAAINASYSNGKTDEFIEPVVIKKGGRPVGKISDGEAVLFFNFRSDRARELTGVFIDEKFSGFERRKPLLRCFVTMTAYDPKLNLKPLFSPQPLTNILGEVLSRNRVTQFRVSETEKYAHVTFFFNGGIETPFPGETRRLIPSVKDVPTYDKCPAMRAVEIADFAIDALDKGDFGFMLINFANGDMVGHTGIMEAAQEACRIVDDAVERVVSTALRRGWTVMLTSDHGNVEQMIDYDTHGPHTAHTTNPVPFILMDDALKGCVLRKGLGLSSVAPTVLKIMGAEIPKEMDGAIF